MISNVYSEEESKGYLLFHLTCHPHIPRYRSFAKKLRGCVEMLNSFAKNKCGPSVKETLQGRACRLGFTGKNCEEVKNQG